ncbi:GntR family transcriptional regulator [Ornithinimicrobium cavernae]|uniref:GntR family transcriptional regulator n=1 Tax=Ornithinimicrobium cavernae TaxID=2666047 RepID=UPI000D687FB4|nr:GntR family transcriptional regulator [Ornithinimicrobium cavernae]
MGKQTEVSQPLAGPRVAPVTSVSRREGVVSELRRSIVLGHLKPGERLTESGLSTALGVSRPTVREALNQVSQEGLLLQEPYRGLRVADLTPTEVLDMARVRMALDLQATTDILSDTSGRRVARVIEAWARCAPDLASPDPLVQHDAHLELHRSIWAAAENSFLIRLWPAIQAHMTIALARDQAAQQDRHRNVAGHQAIIEAFRSRDIEAVRRALEIHTLVSARELADIMSRSNAGDSTEGAQA